MDVRVITLRYSDGQQGLDEQALAQAKAGREVLEVREHFFVHGNVPHLALVLLLGDGTGASGPRTATGPDPGDELPEELRSLYRDLKRWRNERARADGVPAYAIARNAQLAELCRKQPRSLAALREIEGFGEATCEKYGKELLGRIPPEGGTTNGSAGSTGFSRKGVGHRPPEGGTTNQHPIPTSGSASEKVVHP